VAENQRHTGQEDTGTGISPPGPNYHWNTGDAITVEDEYTRIEWLEIKGVRDEGDAIYFANSPSGANGSVSNVYVHSFWQSNPNSGVKVDAVGITIRNCFMTGGTSRGITVDSGSATIENCTIIGNPGSGHGVYAPTGDVAVRNTISVDHATGYDFYVETAGSATISYFGYNMFTRIGGGFDPASYQGGNQSPPADIEDLFVTAASSADLHIETTGHDALDTGLDLSASSGFGTDIDGTTRAGLAWDIGADETTGVPDVVNYRSVGTETATLYSDGTVTIEPFSTLATFGGTASLPTYMGQGDRLQIGSTTYYILARDSATQLRVQQAPSFFGHFGETYTITRAYDTFQAWEDARDGDLVAAGSREVAVAYDDDETSGSGDFTAGALITGWTTDSDHFLKITVAPGHRHAGVAGAGVVVDPGGNPPSDLFDVRSDADSTEIEWLQITNFTNNATGAIIAHPDVLLQNLLIYDFDALAGAIEMYGGGTIRNSIFYNGDTGIFLNMSGPGLETGIIENCTIKTTVNCVKSWPGAYPVEIRNTIAVGSNFADFALLNDTIAYFGYNMYSPDKISGFDPADHQGHNKAPPSDLENLFLSLVSPFENLHLEASGHSAGNRGIDLSSSFTGDIDEETRTGGWDMGADEVIPGEATPTIVSWKEIEP
jgi:hypothetical protein